MSELKLIVDDGDTIYSSEPVDTLEDGIKKAEDWMGSHCLVKIVKGEVDVKVLQNLRSPSE